MFVFFKLIIFFFLGQYCGKAERRPAAALQNQGRRHSGDPVPGGALCRGSLMLWIELCLVVRRVHLSFASSSVLSVSRLAADCFVSLQEVFAKAHEYNSMKAWGVRAAGWALMFLSIWLTVRIVYTLGKQRPSAADALCSPLASLFANAAVLPQWTGFLSSESWCPPG